MLAKFIYVDFTKLSLINFTVHNFCWILYFETVLESCKPGQKSYLHFPGLRLFDGQTIFWSLKLLRKTAKLPSKARIAMQTTWLNCFEKHTEEASAERNKNFFNQGGTQYFNNTHTQTKRRACVFCDIRFQSQGADKKQVFL